MKKNGRSKGNSLEKNTLSQHCEWLARKLFWFVFVPVFSGLSYYTQIRPYFLINDGTYLTGLIDGAVIAVSIVIFVIWLISKVKSDEN